MRLALLKPYCETPSAQVFALWFFSALALVVPLFIWPAAQDAFVLPKSVLLHAGTWILLGTVLGQSLYDRPFRILLHPVNGFLALFVLWQGLSILWSQSPALARDQFCASAMLLLFSLMVQSILIDDRRRVIGLGAITVFSSTLVACWAVAIDFIAAFRPQALAVRQTLFDWRDFISTASFGNTSHIADFVVMGFLITLAFFLTSRRRVAAVVCMIALWIQSAALIVCWSVHSNASLIIAALLMVFLLAHYKSQPWLRRRLRLAVPLIAGWVCVVLFFVVDHPVNPHGSAIWGRSVTSESPASGGIFAQAFSSGRWKEGGPTRLAIWLTTLEMASEHPWGGVGAGNFTYVYPATTSELVLGNPDLAPYAASWTNAAHNTMLQTWSETGIPGLLLLLGAVASAFFYMTQRRKTGDFGNEVILCTAIAMLAAFCIQAQMNFPEELPVSSHVLFILLGIPLVLPQRRNERDLLMPVRRDFGPIRLGIQLKNMQYPTEVHLGVKAPRAFVMVIALLLIAASAIPAWMSIAPLRSSILYRPVYSGMREPGALQDRARVRLLESQARRALEMDESNVDCRSALSDLLVRTGQFEKALPEIELVRQRLNAFEVYLRAAIALEQTGRRQEAAENWNVVFTRRPDLAAEFPAQFREWLARQE